MHKMIKIFCLLFFIINSDLIYPVDRIPKPEFESDYKLPDIQKPLARNMVFEYIDVAILIIAISLASYFAIKKRSRNMIFIMMMFSIAYFGFYRKGCICSIGAIQNIAYGIFNSQYAIPVTAVLFFFIPLVFTLFFGRTYCSSVCPFGSLQDFVLIKNIKVPIIVKQVLSILPFIYLGSAVLFAATGSSFLICRFDPFVNLFRLNGNFSMIVYGLAFILLSMFIARPYCRFLCPYGLILNFISKFSRKHVEITNKECISCGLCKTACPEDYILQPSLDDPDEDKNNIKKLKFLFIFMPLIILIICFAGSYSNINISFFDKKVQLASQIKYEESTGNELDTFEAKAFKSSNTEKSVLYKEADDIRKKFALGGAILGLFIGLVIIIKLTLIIIKRKIDHYKIDKGSCFSCGRCLSFCPLMKKINTELTENTEL